MERIKKTWLWVFIMALYKLTIYPYLEPNKYYEELINDVFENDIPRILREMGYEESLIKKVCDESPCQEA